MVHGTAKKVSPVSKPSLALTEKPTTLQRDVRSGLANFDAKPGFPRLRLVVDFASISEPLNTGVPRHL